MGSAASEPDRGPKGMEGPQHEVTIVKPFAAGRFAVTRDEFEAFLKGSGYEPEAGCYIQINNEWKIDVTKSYRSPGFTQTGSHPVICVSWNDAEAYAKWLSERTGSAYRLLSESEREYVARAGTTTPFWWGRSITPEQANYDGTVMLHSGGGRKGDFRRATVRVKSFPNPWGLYQVHGNVWEWVEDCWSDNYQNTPRDGSPNLSPECARRVLRGGSWNQEPWTLRAAYRGANSQDMRGSYSGFRVARTLN